MATTYCDRCGNTFSMHMLTGWECCIGCERPPVLFRYEMIEVKPYDYPITKIIEENPTPDVPIHSGITEMLRRRSLEARRKK